MNVAQLLVWIYVDLVFPPDSFALPWSGAKILRQILDIISLLRSLRFLVEPAAFLRRLQLELELLFDFVFSGRLSLLIKGTPSLVTGLLHHLVHLLLCKLLESFSRGLADDFERRLLKQIYLNESRSYDFFRLSNGLSGEFLPAVQRGGSSIHKSFFQFSHGIAP